VRFCRRPLLVLDTCEHVISAAATLVEAVLRAGGTLRLLARCFRRCEVLQQIYHSG
jgi:predicted ATPase